MADRGQVGIGTLIVFIAMVLVAAIAAGVLINTAGFLQTQAEDTGTESTEQVANTLSVITTVGVVGSDGTSVDELRVALKPGAGAGTINLEDVTLQLVGEDSFGNFVHVHAATTESSAAVFATESITAEDGVDQIMTDRADRYEVIVPLDEARPFVVEAALSGNDGTLAIDEDNDAVVLESVDAADRPAKLDVVVESGDDAAAVADAFDVEESAVYEVSVPGDGQGSNVTGAELFKNAGTTLDDTVDDGDFETTSADAGLDSTDVNRFVVFDSAVDPTELEGFGDPDAADFTEAFVNDLDNSGGLDRLKEDETAELVVVTGSGGQTVTVLTVPDTLASETDGDGVDL